jgi:hypothetical protein
MLVVLDPPQVPMQLQKNILRHLFRHATLTEDPKRDREHPRLVPLYDPSKCLRRLVQRARPPWLYPHIRRWASRKMQNLQITEKTSDLLDRSD